MNMQKVFVPMRGNVSAIASVRVPNRRTSGQRPTQAGHAHPALIQQVLQNSHRQANALAAKPAMGIEDEDSDGGLRRQATFNYGDRRFHPQPPSNTLTQRNKAQIIENLTYFLALSFVFYYH